MGLTKDHIAQKVGRTVEEGPRGREDPWMTHPGRPAPQDPQTVTPVSMAT